MPVSCFPGSLCTAAEVEKTRCSVLEKSAGSMQKSSRPDTLVTNLREARSSAWTRMGCRLRFSIVSCTPPAATERSTRTLVCSCNFLTSRGSTSRSNISVPGPSASFLLKSSFPSSMSNTTTLSGPTGHPASLSKPWAVLYSMSAAPHSCSLYRRSLSPTASWPKMGRNIVEARYTFEMSNVALLAAPPLFIAPPPPPPSSVLLVPPPPAASDAAQYSRNTLLSRLTDTTLSCL
mmetsp:Transcript_31279/g.78358  ORF Transcript_31279/g.78358 Transcript_31279/m.78358 type:complete len:234 (-) Transcript_31279:384-1085(-)